MQIKKFPHEQDFDIQQKAKEEIHKERKRSLKREEWIKQSIKDEQANEVFVLFGTIGGAIIGFILGLFACYSIYSHGADGYFLMLLCLVITGGFLGMVIGKIKHKPCTRSADDEIAEERFSLSMAIQQILNQADIEKENYRRNFEAEAQQLSTQYVSSPLTLEISCWMTEKFSKIIEEKPRVNSIEIIEIPFSFDVNAHSVRYESRFERKFFNFTEERYSNLETPMEQAALAHAIASIIKTNTENKYQTDVCGTNTTVLTSFQYHYADRENYKLSVQLTYTAPNSLYQAIRDW